MKKVSNKIEIYFNDHAYNIQLENLKKNVITLNRAVDLSKVITENNVKEFNITKVNDWLYSKTDYKNLLAITDLFGCKTEYMALSVIDNNKENLLSEFISFEDGNYTVTNADIDALKDHHKTFLKESKNEAYNILQQIVELSNKLSSQELGALNKAINGEFSINVFKLNQDFK